MAAENDRSARRATDPLVAGVSDGVAAGYEALEHVLDGLRGSIRHRARSGYAGREGRRPRPEGERPGGDPLEDLAGIAAELLDRGADLARDVAARMGERPSRRGGGPAVLGVRVAAGERGQVEFRITNTSPVALRDIALANTPLLGARAAIGDDAVTFEPAKIERIRPGGSLAAIITVAVPDKAGPGAYRGVVAADPGDAWAVLEVDVEPGKNGQAEAAA